MNSAGDFARGEEMRNRLLLRIQHLRPFIDFHPAQRMMHGDGFCGSVERGMIDFVDQRFAVEPGIVLRLDAAVIVGNCRIQ